jgi:hypothetical protein
MIISLNKRIAEMLDDLLGCIARTVPHLTAGFNARALDQPVRNISA